MSRRKKLRFRGWNSGDSMKNVLLSSVAAIALCAAVSTQASAAVSGDIGGSYANVTNSGGADIWNIQGGLSGMFSGNWGAEAHGGYHNISDAGGNLDIWNVGGSLFWQHMSGRLAAQVNYDSLSFSGIDVNITSYGVSGEWYAGPNFTVAVKGGGDTGEISGFGSSVSDNGGYAGGNLTWYAMPNLALSGNVDYIGIDGSHQTTEEVKAEWMFSNTMPVSIYGGYQHLDCGSGFVICGGNSDVLFVGAKFYFGQGGSGTLVDRQREEGLSWTRSSPVFINQY